MSGKTNSHTGWQEVVTGALWCAFLYVCFLLAASFALWLLAANNYCFSLWYDMLHIDQHLATFAAQNTQKPGFHLLAKADHVAAFNGIANAVVQQGEGLAQLNYVYQGQTIRLLTDDEIVHLQDVATLYSQVKIATFILLLLWPGLAWLALRKPLANKALFRWLGLLVPFLPVLLWLFIAGPEAVFYQLHGWWFPADNPWFFYWQESHMSALMKAPILFAAIGATMLVITLCLTPILYWAGRLCFQR